MDILFNSTALGIHFCETSLIFNFKTRLGGEICLCDVNMHKGYYKLAALEVFLPNRNAFVFVASLKIHCRNFEKSDFTHFLLGNFPGGVLKEFLGGDVPL